MKFYIAVDENNAPQNHPASEENLKLVFPSHDFEVSAPSGWVEFERIPEPVLNPYQYFDETIGADIAIAFEHNGLEYKFVDGKFKDVWHVLEISEEEKKAKQDAVKAKWAALDPPGHASWTFDENTWRYKAPVPLPSDVASASNPDGVFYKWNEETLSWDIIDLGE